MKKKTAKAVFWIVFEVYQCSIKSLQASLSATENKRMHIVRALGVHSFQIDHVANDVVFVVNAIAAVHIARHAGNI